MIYKEESYVLNIIIEIQETIISPEFKQLIKGTHENNIMSILINIPRFCATKSPQAFDTRKR